MSEAEVRELILIHAGQIDSAFEFWIAISFGVLVALHIIRGRQVRSSLKFLISGLYGTASISTLALAVADFAAVLHYALTVPAQPAFIGIANLVGGSLKFLALIVGSMAIVISVFQYEKWFADEA